MKYSHKKIVHGPGGIKCDCCRRGGTSVKSARVALNRRNRRAFKISKEIVD